MTLALLPGSGYSGRPSERFGRVGLKPDNFQTPDDDEAERARHQSRVNLIAAAGIGMLLLIAYGTVKLFSDHETLQSCVDSGRRNCGGIEAAPREGARVITR